MQHTAPLQHEERADILDILRAFALLGICMANAAYFSLYIFQKPVTTQALPTATADRWLSWFHFAFIDGKFYSLFSLLFGIGFSIIFLRNKQAGRNGLAVFYRRLIILLLFGLCHSLLLWDGDILMFYALTGMLLPLFRNCSDRTLLILTIALLLSPLLFDLIKVITDGRWNISRPFLLQALATDKKAGITDDNIDSWLMQHRSYNDLLTWSRSGTWWNWQLRLDSNRIPKVLGMFTLGLYVGRKKMYINLETYRSLFRKIQRWGFALGIPTGMAHAWFEFDHQALPAPMGLLDTLSYALNVVPLSLAYTSTIVLWYMNKRNSCFLQFIKSAGRMALTNYIMQTVLGIIIYYGIGLGLGTRVGPAIFLPAAIVIFMLQVIYSNWWFRHFSYGPLEWIWRMLTYGRWLAIKKRPS
ncbi:MAG: DUF418 domain-containing protein [Chitinophagaceae bacterium]